MTNDRAYDVLIVGGGHAGLSAALTLYRHLHRVLIFDTGKPRDAWSQPIHVVSGWEGRQAKELRLAARAELLSTGLIDFEDDEAISVVQVDSRFEVTTAQGKQFSGRKLLISIGSQNVFPNIPGFKENYPDLIFHCMFTFGYEHRGAMQAGLLAEGALSSPFHAAMVVGDTKKFAENITIFTNGNSLLKEKMESQIKHSGVTFDNTPIIQIRRAASGAGLNLQLEGGSSSAVDFLVHQPATKFKSPLISQLGLDLDDRGDIKNTPPFFGTNVHGVFVAGDCGTPFKIIPMAMFMGAQAGAGIARSLAADNISRELEQSAAI
ncbi:hypothetical protein F5Y12DRAFT_717865 [Xylaria sp. FL1777]|nr:hypothetical protein F5Y12DRAFT_717865 [Xylaria sp. FL1777]